MTVEAYKRAAAAAALEFVRPGMRIGLGSGSTARVFVELLSERVRSGLAVVGVPTSEATRRDAERLGVPLTTLDETPELDLTIDGADEIAPDLNLIKGGGGALLREKIVAAASDRMIVIVDRSKLVDRLGTHVPLPVEIVSFGWQTVAERLSAIGAVPTLRRVGEEPFVTDSGNYIADCAFPAIADPAALQAQLATTTGVVECGLFIGLARAVVIGGRSGVEILER